MLHTPDVYAVFLATILLHGVLASVMSKIMGKLQTVFVVMNFVLIFATIIALPIGARYHRNDGHYIFADVENLTTWPTGWTFMLAWLSPIWTIGMYRYNLNDTCSLETTTPALPFLSPSPAHPVSFRVLFDTVLTYGLTI